ncbi:hypothetical protein ACHAXS_009062, partial [Conticribra weissflogii]
MPIKGAVGNKDIAPIVNVGHIATQRIPPPPLIVFPTEKECRKMHHSLHLHLWYTLDRLRTR